jgi:hypothetical protein
MSDFFRIPANPDLAGLGLTTLARLSHEAEETSDDILLMQVADEVRSRGEPAVGIHRDEYLRLQAERRTRRPGCSPSAT